MRAGSADHAAPLDPALGGDFLPAVETVSAVVVGVLQVLCDELQAFVAAGDLVRFVGVDGEGRFVAAQRPVPGAVVDYGGFLVRSVVRVRQLVGQWGAVEMGWCVVEVPAWMAEGQLGVGEQCVQVIGGGHRSESLCFYRDQSLADWVDCQEGVF